MATTSTDPALTCLPCCPSGGKSCTDRNCNGRTLPLTLNAVLLGVSNCPGTFWGANDFTSWVGVPITITWDPGTLEWTGFFDISTDRTGAFTVEVDFSCTDFAVQCPGGGDVTADMTLVSCDPFEADVTMIEGWCCGQAFGELTPMAHWKIYE